jgi:hypothetical protein
MELQQPDHEREADGEPLGDLTDRALLADDRIHDPTAEILRIGGHGAPPPRILPTNRMPIDCLAL